MTPATWNHAAIKDLHPTAILQLTPDAAHLLVVAKPDDIVGPQHVLHNPTPGHILMRPIFFVLEINPQGRVTSARVSNKTRHVYAGTSVRVPHGAIAITANNTLIIDWRPDYIQGRPTTSKTSIRHPVTGTTLPRDEFIVIHQTLDDPKNEQKRTRKRTKARTDKELKQLEQVGFGINAALNRNACGHYLIDTDGFVIKNASEAIDTNHAGGDDGDHWEDLRSRRRSSSKPPRTISSFNAISVGIEHVRALPLEPELGRTTMTKEQTVASHALVRAIWAGRTVGQNRIVTHNQIAISKQNRLGVKRSCPGAGYEWGPLEAAGLALTTTFAHVFTPAEMPILNYLEERKRAKKEPVIDADADGRGVVKILKRALADIGYFLPTLDDTYDAALIEALFAFLMRHYSGTSNEDLLNAVQDRSSGDPIANRHLVSTVLETRRHKRLNKTTTVKGP